MARALAPSAAALCLLALCVLATPAPAPSPVRAAAQPLTRPVFRHCPCVLVPRVARLVRAGEVFMLRRAHWRARSASGLGDTVIGEPVRRSARGVLRDGRAGAPWATIEERGAFALLFRRDGHATFETPEAPLVLRQSRSRRCPIVMRAEPAARLAAAGPVELRQPPMAPRISGGDRARPRTQSHMVSLTDALTSCSGSLLSRRWVLTAAHCDVRTHWRVRIGTENAKFGTSTPIERVFIHENYTETLRGFDSDIALIELAKDAPEWATFILVNLNPHLPLLGSFSRAIGYGKLFEEERGPEFALRQVDVPTVQWNRCWERYKPLSVDVKPKLHVCSGYVNGGCSFCKGDSGGPVVQYDARGRATQLGIISFQDGCAERGVPAVSLRLSSFVDWMLSKGAIFEVGNSTVDLYTDASKAVTSAIGESSSTTTGTVNPSATVPPVINEQPGDSSDASNRSLRIGIIVGIAGVGMIAFFVTHTLTVMHARSRRRIRENSDCVGRLGELSEEAILEVSEGMDYTGHSEHSQSSVSSELSEHSDFSENSGGSEHSDGSENSSNSNRSDESNHSDRSQNSDSPEHSENFSEPVGVAETIVEPGAPIPSCIGGVEEV